MFRDRDIADKMLDAAGRRSRWGRKSSGTRKNGAGVSDAIESAQMAQAYRHIRLDT
jgi:hypothetical protein